jgi:peptide deformylase
MAVYQIVKIGDPILRQKAKEIKRINQNVLKLLDNLKDTMYAANGVGLAAPQIGISKRAIVVDTGEEKRFLELINPELIKAEGLEVGIEGCLSIPGVQDRVARPQNIVVRGISREGEEIEIEADNYLARAILHEMDHLEGILFIDKIVAETEEDG